MSRTICRIIFAGFLSLLSSAAYGYYWGDSTSEENYPSVCRFGDLMSGFNCTGWYCDNVRPECQSTRLQIVSRFWTLPISEENLGTCSATSGVIVRCNNYQQLCGPDGFMSGVACSGAYCDNVSLECVYLRDFRQTGCYWTPWISEEDGGSLFLPDGYYAAGMECSGAYCDNQRFYACQLGPR